LWRTFNGNEKNMESHHNFWLDWFGSFGRELGAPERWFTDTPGDLLRHVQECTSHQKPCFMSVQPYRARNMVLGLERCFFDFDSKTDPPDRDKAWNDAFALSNHLKREANVEPLIVATFRGYHAYIFFWSTVEFNPNQQVVAKELYTQLQRRLLNDHSYPTLDSSVLGDIKRLSRVPYSWHEKGVVCTPVDLGRQPLQLDSLDIYREHGIQQDYFREVLEEIKNKRIAKEILKIFDSFKPKAPSHVRSKWRIRPCFLLALKSGEMPHEMRMALCYEAYCAGLNRGQIVDLYRSLHDFDEATTSYQINWLLDRKQGQKIKPYRCKTIQRKGWCLGEACPMFKR